MKIQAWGFISRKTGKLLPWSYKRRKDAVAVAECYFLIPKVVKVTLIYQLPAKKAGRKGK